MRHFIAYHSAARMGYTAEESDPLSLYTSKKIGNPIGDVVWVVTGRGGKPMEYYLSSWFTIEMVAPADHPGFGVILSGAEGEALDPLPRLDQLEWFPTLRRRMANFSIGLTQLRDPAIIEALHQIAVVAER